MPKYKMTVWAGAGMLAQDVSEDVMRTCLRNWIKTQTRDDRLIIKITVDFHNGPAAEFTLIEGTTDDAPKLLRPAAGGPAAKL